MAKIKQVKMKLGLNPARPYEETVININYDGTDRSTETYRRKIPSERFYINLPKVVADALGMVDVRGNDQFMVSARFEEAIEKFKRLKTEINKVILYEFKVEPKPGARDGKFSPGRHEVSVWAGTYEETVAIAGDGTRRYSYNRVDSDVNFASNDYPNYGGRGGLGSNGARDDDQVPWTEQSAAFFIWIKERMIELIARLCEIKEPGDLVEAINAGRLLPLGDPVQGRERGPSNAQSKEVAE